MLKTTVPRLLMMIVIRQKLSLPVMSYGDQNSAVYPKNSGFSSKPLERIMVFCQRGTH